MKKIFFTISIVIFTQSIGAQVGLGTTEPKVLFDIKENRESISNDSNSKDGIMIPHLTKLELATKSENTYDATTLGTIVFVHDTSGDTTGKPSAAQVIEIINPGFYFFGSNNRWVATEGDTSNDVWSNNSTNQYTELKSTANGATRATNSNIVINDNGYIGINTTNPQKRLHINAAITGTTPQFLKFENLKEIDSNINSSTLVIDAYGNVYKNDVENLTGQIMRIPISEFSTTELKQGPLRLDFSTTNESPACVINNLRICNPNFVNYIKGVNTTDLLKNVTLVGETGTVNRITDRVKLPQGVYKITVKVDGHYTARSFNDENVITDNGTTILKLAINNKEYALQNYHESTFGVNALTSLVFVDYLNLNQDSTIDLLFHPIGRDFKVVPHLEVDIPNPNYNQDLPTSENNPVTLKRKILKSMVLIERLR